MDSVSSSLPLAARDGTPEAAANTVEDDSTLSVVAGLAKEAALLFQAGKFLDCLRVLNQLLLKKTDDPKVLHNIAVAESFQDGFSDPKKLIEALQQIQKQSDQPAHTSEEHSDLTSGDGRTPTAGPKGTNHAAHQFSSPSVLCNEEFDASVAVFNIAVVWYHLHEYAKSFSYLDALYQNIEPIDEGTALRICHLLLDVALLSHHASRSADVINYMEKVFCVNSLSNQVENGSSTQQQSSLASKSSLHPSNSTISDSSHPDSVHANTLENSLSMTLSEEALEDDSLQLLSSLDISGQNLQRLSGIASSNDPMRGQAEDSLSVVDLKLKLHLYKVRLLLLTRNLKAAKREVKMAMNLARGRDYPMALYLKSQLEYARRNPRKAIKLLMASSNRTEIGISSMYYNNLGCIYYQLGKHQTSGVFFSKALKNNSLVRKEKPINLLNLSQDKSYMISYNCGMHSLVCGRPFHAARCFEKASIIFYNRPLLWLRIAECCLMALEKGLIKSDSSAVDISDIKVDVIGKGKWRHLALRYGVSPNGQCNVGKVDLCPGNGKQPDLSLTLAWQCLVNSLYLLDSSEGKYSRSSSTPSTDQNELRETFPQSTNPKNVSGGDEKESDIPSGSSQVNSNGEVKDQKGNNQSSSSIHNSIAEYECIRMKENQMMKQAILANLAYVELALGNPLKALSTAKSLLKLPECSRMYIFLGTMYAAEALCLLNRPQEAADLLMSHLSGGDHIELPYSREDCVKWTAEKLIDSEDSNGGAIASNGVSTPDESLLSLFSSPEEARGIFAANFAANVALLGDFDRAHHFVLKALADVPNSPHAILTSIYVDLKRGKTQDAIAKLKTHGSVRFLPSNYSFNGSS